MNVRASFCQGTACNDHARTVAERSQDKASRGRARDKQSNSAKILDKTLAASLWPARADASPCQDQMMRMCRPWVLSNAILYIKDFVYAPQLLCDGIAGACPSGRMRLPLPSTALALRWAGGQRHARPQCLGRRRTARRKALVKCCVRTSHGSVSVGLAGAAIRARCTSQEIAQPDDD